MDKTKDFLKRYHKMANDTINQPKIFKNLKEGDKIYQVKLYRKNGQLKEVTFNEYTVFELTEYYVDDHSKPFVPKSFFVNVMMTCYVYGGEYGDKGAWVTRPTTAIEVFKDDLTKDTIVRDNWYDSYAYATSFYKEKALNEIRKIVTNYKKDNQKAIEKEIASLNRQLEGYNKNYECILNDIDNEANK